MVKTLSILAALFPALTLAQGDGVIPFGTKLVPKAQVAQSQEFAKSLAKPGSPGWQAKGDQRRTYRFPGTETDLPYQQRTTACVQNAQTLERSEQDVINVLEMVLNEYPVDRSAMFLAGHSMGGGSIS